MAKKHQYQILKYSEYEITGESLEDNYLKSLPKKLQQKVKEEIEELHDLAYSKPKEAIPNLERVIEQYPTIPQFYNFLSMAYGNLGENERAEEIVKETYKKFPNYLFAR